MIESICRMIAAGGIKIGNRVYFTELYDFVENIPPDHLPIAVYFEIDTGKWQSQVYAPDYDLSKVIIARYVIMQIKNHIKKETRQ